MADKKKNKSGWNSLSPSQKSDFKAKNFDMSIKVSESTIQGLRDGKTFEGNVAKFKSGMTAEQREAMNRFYGKNRVGAALGDGVATINKTYPANSYNIPNKTTNNPGPNYKGAGSTNYTPPKAPGKSFGSMAGGFVKNELLGVDDFTRTVKYAKEGNVGKALKSGLTGTAELGTTAATLIGSALTGGTLGGAVWGAKATAYAAKEGAKQVAKQGAKATAAGAAKGAGKVVTSVATGSVKTGVKNVGSGVKTTVKAVKNVKKPVDPRMTAAKNVAARNLAKAEALNDARKSAVTTARAARGVSQAATQNVKRAETGLSALQKGRKSKVVTPGELSSARGKVAEVKKTAAAVSKVAAKKTAGSRSASSAARTQKEIATRSANRVTALQKKKEAAKKKGKMVRTGARRAQYVHFGAATITRDGNK